MIARIHLRWLAVALLLIFTPLGTQAQLETSLGPAGGDVRALAADPTHPDTVYLGSTDGHIFGSRDTGRHWELLGRVGSSSDAVVTSLLVDPRDSLTIFASIWKPETTGEGGGVFMSRDAGRTWQPSGLAGHAVRALAQSASDPDVLIAGALDGVFRSRDAGKSWQAISPPDLAELRNLDSIAIDPQNPEIIFAGTFHLPWKTSDGGEHWFPIHRGMIDDSDVLSIAIDPANSQRIYASACSGIYRSLNAGGSWEKIQGIPYSSRRTPVIRIDPANPANLYAGTTEGLWKSSDAGANWRRVSPKDWVINSLVILPDRSTPDAGATSGGPAPLLVGTEQHGVLSSVDAGETFEESNLGFHHYRIVAMAVDSNRPGHMAAVLKNAPEAVSESQDGGISWSPIDRGLEGYSVRHIFSAPGGWWVSLASGGLARFDSGKRLWVRAGSILGAGAEAGGPHMAEISSRLNRENQAFDAAVNDLEFTETAWFAATANGLYVSRDAGNIWSLFSFAPLALPVDSVRASRDAGKIWIVSSRGIVVSGDAGIHWQWHDLPLDSGGALRLEFADDETALAVSRTGLFISRDAGSSWQRAQRGLPDAPVEDLLVRPGFWLVSIASHGLYVSSDRGASWSIWEDFSSARERPRISALAAEQGSGSVYAASVSDGIFLVTAGRSFAVRNVNISGR